MVFLSLINLDQLFVYIKGNISWLKWQEAIL